MSPEEIRALLARSRYISDMDKLPEMTEEELQRAHNLMNSWADQRPNYYDQRALSLDEMIEINAQRFQRLDRRLQ